MICVGVVGDYCLNMGAGDDYSLRMKTGHGYTLGTTSLRRALSGVVITSGKRYSRQTLAEGSRRLWKMNPKWKSAGIGDHLCRRCCCCCFCFRLLGCFRKINPPPHALYDVAFVFSVGSVPSVHLYPARHLVTADTACTVNDLDDLDDFYRHLSEV